MKHIALLLTFIQIFIFSCNESEDCSARPSSCYDERPTEGTMTFEVTINSENPTVLLIVYSGNYELGDEVFRETISSSKVSYTMNLGTYSATVDYASGKNTIRAVDGGSISVSEWSCEEEDFEDSCYELKDGSMNLTL